MVRPVISRTHPLRMKRLAFQRLVEQGQTRTATGSVLRTKIGCVPRLRAPPAGNVPVIRSMCGSGAPPKNILSFPIDRAQSRKGGPQLIQRGFREEPFGRTPKRFGILESGHHAVAPHLMG